ncbi:hypothetical protein [Actinoplanes sp. NPDC049599]|uniref:hypothetical protein n=1 Tax=Actinoplanes sp. NPDC049599 TaxID=3363903 RepID=UPI00378B348B
MAKQLLPSIAPGASATARPRTAYLVGVVTAVVTPLTVFVENAGRAFRGGHRRRARVLAAAQRADAAERARAFGRLLTACGDRPA